MSLVPVSLSFILRCCFFGDEGAFDDNFSFLMLKVNGYTVRESKSATSIFAFCLDGCPSLKGKNLYFWNKFFCFREDLSKGFLSRKVNKGLTEFSPFVKWWKNMRAYPYILTLLKRNGREGPQLLLKGVGCVATLHILHIEHIQ